MAFLSSTQRISSYVIFSDEPDELDFDEDEDPEVFPVTTPKLPPAVAELDELFDFVVSVLDHSSTRTFFHVPNFPSCVTQSSPTSFCVGLCACALNASPHTIINKIAIFFILKIIFNFLFFLRIKHLFNIHSQPKSDRRASITQWCVISIRYASELFLTDPITTSGNSFVALKCRIV